MIRLQSYFDNNLSLLSTVYEVFMNNKFWYNSRGYSISKMSYLC